MSALSGTKRAFTGAGADGPGLLRAADEGTLFLDEIGELGLDEQAMILRAIEEKKFLPVGADREASSDFQLIVGTNRELGAEVAAGRFRDDLFARLNLWTFELPALRDRREDIEPNLDYELDRFAEREGSRVGFNKEARRFFLDFATGPAASWAGNFRDLAASVTRMATFAPAGRIDVATVEAEMARMKRLWAGAESAEPERARRAARRRGAAKPRPVRRVQLAEVVRTCRASRSLSEAGRTLFSASRARRSSSNDADRLRKYLQRFGLDWAKLGGLRT